MNQLQKGDCIAYDPNIFGETLTFDDLLKMVGQKVILETEWDDEMELEDIAYAEVVEIVETNGIWIKYDNHSSEIQTMYREEMAHKCRQEYIRAWAIRDPAPESAVVVSAEYTKAVTLTRHIIANAQAMQASLYEVCKGLKEMRDGKLYKELGYQNFEDYCENEVGFTRRQTYNYISIAENLSSDFVKSISQIGSTKLALLAKLDEADREELTQRVNPQETSVKELQAEIKRLKAERTEMIEHHVAEQGDFLRKIDQLQGRVQQLESRPAEVYKYEKDQAEIERLTAENNQLKIENEALEEQRDELEGKLFTMENDCQEGAVSDAEEKRFAEFTSAMNQQLVEETHRIHEEAQEEISRANLQRDNAFAEVTKLREQLALAQKPAVQESLSGSDGEFDAYFRMFDDALKHMTSYLIRKDCTDFSRKQSISMIETKFEKYISALKEERK